MSTAEKFSSFFSNRFSQERKTQDTSVHDGESPRKPTKAEKTAEKTAKVAAEKAEIAKAAREIATAAEELYFNALTNKELATQERVARKAAVKAEVAAEKAEKAAKEAARKAAVKAEEALRK